MTTILDIQTELEELRKLLPSLSSINKDDKTFLSNRLLYIHSKAQEVIDDEIDEHTKDSHNND